MVNRPTITLVDNPVAVSSPAGGGETPQPATAARPKRTQAPKRKAAAKERPAASVTVEKAIEAEAVTNPYAGMRKVQIPVRLFPPLWDRLDEFVRVLRDENLDVDKTALLNAMLHFNGPTSPDDARDLVNRWRALLASPPARTNTA
jgi:hypothetical protein